MGLQKSLVAILHEHNNDYHKGQNGWSGEMWNLMTKIFQEQNKHVNFTKSQLQDKEKELKRDYMMLKEARKQSGAGWCEKSCQIIADDALWENLVISFSKIGKFKRLDFPLFDTLGDLYDGQTAEGTYNFTSTHEPSENLDDDDVQSVNGEDDLQILDGGSPAQRVNEANPFINVDAGEKVDSQKQHIQKKHASVPKKKPSKSDAMVEVVNKYVKMKQKQAEEEKTEANVYSISKCISALQNIKELSHEERVKASKLFKIVENREMFLAWAAQDEESAVMWLRDELQELP